MAIKWEIKLHHILFQASMKILRSPRLTYVIYYVLLKLLNIIVGGMEIKASSEISEALKKNTTIKKLSLRI